MGLLGVIILEEWGGVGFDSIAVVIIYYELSKFDLGFMFVYFVYSMLFVNNFFYNSSEVQREQYLLKILMGEWIGVMGMTEFVAGIDVLGMCIIVCQEGDRYVFNGCKIFIINGIEVIVYFIYVKVNDRIIVFVVE